MLSDLFSREGTLSLWNLRRLPAISLLLALSLLAAESAQTSTERPKGTAAEVAARSECVILVRAGRREDVGGAIELAALQAGAFVIDQAYAGEVLRKPEHRLRIRVRDVKEVWPVLSAIRSVPGVKSATATLLPAQEAPLALTSTYDNGDGEGPDNSTGIVRREIPVVKSKEELLHDTDIPTGPGTLGWSEPGYAPVGGFTLNVSDMIRFLKRRHWQKREEKMRRAYLPILPASEER